MVQEETSGCLSKDEIRYNQLSTRAKVTTKNDDDGKKGEVDNSPLRAFDKNCFNRHRKNGPTVEGENPTFESRTKNDVRQRRKHRRRRRRRVRTERRKRKEIAVAKTEFRERQERGEGRRTKTKLAVFVPEH